MEVDGHEEVRRLLRVLLEEARFRPIDGAVDTVRVQCLCFLAIRPLVRESLLSSEVQRYLWWCGGATIAEACSGPAFASARRCAASSTRHRARRARMYSEFEKSVASAVWLR